MPFSVLRSFILFLFSWIILGAGVYFAYDVYRSFQASPTRVQAIRDPVVLDTLDNPLDTTDDLSLEPAVLVPIDNRDQYRWLKLVIAIVCIGFTFGGRAPLRLFMKSDPAVDSIEHLPSSSFQVTRPDGSLLHGEIFGNDQKPTLLFTHGWSLDSSAWKYMTPTLVSRYRVVVWDLAGLGQSRGPQNNDFSLEKLADDLNAVLEQVAPKGPVVLVGHSIGGMTQQTFCRLHPEKLGKFVKGIVMLQTTYTNPLETNLLSAVVKPLEPVVAFMNFVMIPLSPLVWLSNWQSYFNGSAHWAARLESFTGKQTWKQLDHSARLGARAWPAVLARGNSGMMKFNEEQTLTKIDVPVLVVAGTNDRLTLESASQHIEKLIPSPIAHSHAGGHLGHWEHNAAVCQMILDFADKVLSSPALRPVKLDVS